MDNHNLMQAAVDDDIESPLCDTCKAVRMLYPTAKTVAPFLSTTKEALVIQANNGCHLCNLFLSRCETSPDGKLEYQKYSNGDTAIRHIYLGGKALTLARMPTATHEKERILEDTGCITDHFIENKQQHCSPSSTISSTKNFKLSESRLAQVRHWMTECVTHKKCQQINSQQQFIPSRLICIDSLHPPRLHLASRHEVPLGTPYMTLSHCWGDSQPFRLLQSNIQDLRENIRFSELPRTFQDAISICQQLDTSYLWIDSLCIIQDSPTDSDWQQEAAEMGSIYSNGKCNICATAATDSSDGLFPNQGQPSILNVKLKLGTNTYIAISPQIWTRGIEDSPLLSRAWVMQERLLSRCNLHFSSTQIFWECSNGSACEQANFLLSDVHHFAKRKNYFALLRPIDGKLSLGPNRFLMLWNDIVQDYSARDLTKDTDRLVALSGIASAFVPLLKHWPENRDGAPKEYIAGLWSYHIIPQLLWYRVTPGREPCNYIAPSWSWASVNDRVQGTFEEGTANARGTASLQTYMSIASIVTWDIRKLNQNQPLGQVTSGTLVIGGKLALATIFPTPHGAVGCFRFEGLPDAFIFQGGEKSMVRRDFDSNYIMRPGSTIYFAPLRAKTIRVSTSHYPLGMWTLEGLLLIPAEQRQTREDGGKHSLPSSYRRVGIWKLKGADHIRGFLKAMRFCDQKYEHMLTEICEEVEAFEMGDTAFRISII